MANALFADGAAAAVVAAPSRETEEDWKVTVSGSNVFPDSEDAMTWRIGSHGFEMTLSPRIPEIIASNLPAWCESWLEENELKISDIRSWAIHPGGPRILDAVEKCLGLPGEMLRVSREILADCGNMSSPTILFILKQLILEKTPRPCVALAFGPGLSVEAALFT